MTKTTAGPICGRSSKTFPGLIGLMGGKQAFQERLDQLFREGLDRSKFEFWNKFPDATGLVGQYSMANEPSFHIPYLYDYAGAPWKTQQKIRLLLSTYFPDNVYGIPGDEDGGGMSAFVVFSSMGFYPVTPGLPFYAIGSPVFSRITIALDNGKQFTHHRSQQFHGQQIHPERASQRSRPASTVVHTPGSRERWNT